MKLYTKIDFKRKIVLIETIYNYILHLSAKTFAFSAVKCFILILIAFQAKSQETKKSFFTEKGFNVGVSIYSIMLPEENNYRLLLLMGNRGLQLTKKEKKAKWWLMFEPQLNPVFLNNKLKEAEFGINVAFRYKYQMTKDLYCYGQLGSGPHFITVSTDRQAHGFIFSDNLAFGISKTLNNKWILNTEFRIRHISNANLMTPNRGMNNLFVLFGLSKRIN